MRFINYYIQLVWMAVITLILISSLFNIDILFIMLYVQFFLGINHYLVSLAWVSVSSWRSRLGVLHFVGANVTLTVLVMFRDYLLENVVIGYIIFFGASWLLAVLFWVISFIMYKDEKDRYSGRFRFLR